MIFVGGQPADGGRDASVHCPFHTLAPSRFIFSSPSPRLIVQGAAAALGHALHDKVKQLAEDKRRADLWPARLPEISQAVWQSSVQASSTPDDQIDLFARMMVGMLEGFLPTVYGTTLKTLYLWLSEGSFWRVQQQHLAGLTEPSHLETDRWTFASGTVMPELRRAMQKRPVPDIIYRTAQGRDQLGDVQVDAGDRIVLLIASVLEDLRDQPDNSFPIFGPQSDSLFPIFGGSRVATPHPTHACPAYQMGMGTTLGILTAILEAGTFSPNPTPLVVDYEPGRFV